MQPEPPRTASKAHPAPGQAPDPNAQDPLRHHQAHRHSGAFGEGLVPRVAEKVAELMGSVQFVIGSTVLIVAWVLVNDVTMFLSTAWRGLLNGRGFDPAPFILLNLVFSAVAYYSASMVMIAQKAQAKRDHLAEAADATHREELATTQAELIRENTALTQQIHQLTLDLHAFICEQRESTTTSGQAAATPAPARPR